MKDTSQWIDYDWLIVLLIGFTTAEVTDKCWLIILALLHCTVATASLSENMFFSLHSGGRVCCSGPKFVEGRQGWQDEGGRVVEWLNDRHHKFWELMVVNQLIWSINPLCWSWMWFIRRWMVLNHSQPDTGWSSNPHSSRHCVYPMYSWRVADTRTGGTIPTRRVTRLAAQGMNTTEAADMVAASIGEAVAVWSLLNLGCSEAEFPMNHQPLMGGQKPSPTNIDQYYQPVIIDLLTWVSHGHKHQWGKCGSWHQVSSCWFAQRSYWQPDARFLVGF